MWPKLRPLSLVNRVLVSSTALLALIFLLLALAPVTVSAPIRVGELTILAAAFAALIALNVLYMRRALAPLTRLAAAMEQIDLAQQERIEVREAAKAPEVLAFTEAFNEMLARLREERRLGARAALTAQERERRRIAQSLHDEAGQTLTAVALEIDRAAAQAPAEQRPRMTALAAELERTLAEIRRIARELRPEALDDLGLVNALIALSTRLARQGGIRIERRLGDGLPPLSEDVELVVYRVAQEALTNVLRHSGAGSCLLELRAAGGWLTLLVADDGRGLPPRRDGATIGIEGMRERALLVGGQLRVESPPQGGTTVLLRVPVEGP